MMVVCDCHSCAIILFMCIIKIMVHLIAVKSNAHGLRTGWAGLNLRASTHLSCVRVLFRDVVQRMQIQYRFERDASMATIVSRRSSVKNDASMATIVSRRSGSIRGVEGGVEKILASIKQKSEKHKYSPLLQRIREVSTHTASSYYHENTGSSASYNFRWLSRLFHAPTDCIKITRISQYNY